MKRSIMAVIIAICAVLSGCTSVHYQRPADPSVCYLRLHTQDTQAGGRQATLTEWTEGRRVGERSVAVPHWVAAAPSTIFAVGHDWQGYLDGPRVPSGDTTIMRVHYYRSID